MSTRSILATLVGLLVFVASTAAQAQFRESFESVEPSWRLAESDCAAKLVGQSRTVHVAHSGTGSEFVRLIAGHGTFAHLTHQVPAALVIPELETLLWVKADRPGLQLLARVVLPRSIDRRTSKPITTWIRGESYHKAGSWQMLTVPAPAKLLERQAQVLRSQLRSEIDTREAFIDLVVLNAYAGANTTNLWIDDLEINGAVAPAAAAVARNSTPPEFAAVKTPPSSTGGATPPTMPTRDASATIELRGATLLLNQRPFLPRVFTPRGESLEFAKLLGCNAVELSEPPTLEQIGQAKRLGLWLTSSAAPMSGEPPSLAAVRNHWTTLPLPSRTATDVIALASATQPIEATRTNKKSLRSATYDALAGGARGFRFPSPELLDGGADERRQFAREIQQVNRELRLLTPWIAGGMGAEEIVSHDPLWRLYVLPHERSRLLLAIRTTAAPQRSAASIASTLRSPLKLLDPGAPSSSDAYLITPTGLQPLRRQRVAGGVQVEIQNDDPIQLVVLTQDPTVVNFLQRSIVENSP